MKLHSLSPPEMDWKHFKGNRFRSVSLMEHQKRMPKSWEADDIAAAIFYQKVKKRLVRGWEKCVPGLTFWLALLRSCLTKFTKLFTSVQCSSMDDNWPVSIISRRCHLEATMASEASITNVPMLLWPVKASLIWLRRRQRANYHLLTSVARS